MQDAKGYTPIFYAAKLKHISALNCLLEDGEADVKITGHSNNKNIFFKARTYEAVMLLRKYGAQAFHDIDLDQRYNTNYRSKTALKYLVEQRYQESPLALLDDTIKEVRDEQYTVDLTFLNEDKPHLDMHGTFVRHRRSDLSLHPSMEIYLHMQWKRVWKIFISLLILDLAFVFTQTYLGTRLVNWLQCEKDETIPNLYHNPMGIHFYKINDTDSLLAEKLDNGSYANTTTIEQFTCHKGHSLRSSMKGPDTLKQFCKLIDGNDVNKCWYFHPINMAIMCVFLPIFFVREAIQFWSGGARSYFLSCENWLQMTSMTLTVCLYWSAPNNIEFGIHAATWAIFFSWIAVTCQLARFDNFGEYVFMSLRVSATVVKFLAVYVPCMLAFSFAFHLSLHQNRTFSGPWVSTLKNFVMIQGEFDFNEIFAYQAVKDSGARNITTQVNNF